MKAVIIAAGQSSRLWEKTDRSPKTLLPYGDGTILSTIVDNMKSCGIQEIIMIVGWKKSEIKSYVKSQDDFGIDVQFIYNEDWKRGNGISVLAAKAGVGDEPFIMSMCDHVVSPSAIKRMIEAKSTKNLLLVDWRVDDIFDIDDATKVQAENGDIVEIGKELKNYNSIDCGLFRLDSKFFAAMQKQLQQGNESISAAVTGLVEVENMGAVDMQNDEYWIDIDTPEAYQHALDIINEH
jgi:choline kinase